MLFPRAQATAILYEQGGLNHDMSFALTAVAFYSLERPEIKVNPTFGCGAVKTFLGARVSCVYKHMPNRSAHNILRRTFSELFL